MKGLFVGAAHTIQAASNLGGVLKDGIEDASELYSYGRNNAMSALDRTDANKGLHPNGLIDNVKTRMTGLLTIQDVIEGRNISDGVVSDSQSIDADEVSFNLCSTLEDNKNIIMKAMLEMELRGELSKGEIVKSAYGTVVVNQELKNQMIESGVIDEDKYKQSLQILINFEKFQKLPGFIADTIIDGTKITVSILIDILLLKFLFSVL